MIRSPIGGQFMKILITSFGQLVQRIFVLIMCLSTSSLCAIALEIFSVILCNRSQNGNLSLLDNNYPSCQLIDESVFS